MNKTTAAGRDRLYFQRERERLAACANLDAEADAAAIRLLTALDLLDEIGESIDLETDGAAIVHHYSGEPVPWLQQRRGEAWAAVVGAHRHLAVVAAELSAAAASTPRSGRLGRIADGHLALAAEGQRVADTFGPGREGEPVDWQRVDAITEGIRRLRVIDVRELRAEIGHAVAAHDRNRAGLLTLGLATYVRDEIDGDTTLHALLGRLRAVAAPAH